MDVTMARILMQEEIQAIHSYNQKSKVVKSKELQRIITHALLEEIQHRDMLMKWINKNR